MYSLSRNEQIALSIGIMSLIVSLIGIILSNNPFNDWLLVFGGLAVIQAAIIGYVFVIGPMRGRVGRGYYYRSYSSSDDFKPSVIPPTMKKKRTVTSGECQYCNLPALMGFICSYCNDYFCSDHRLPEKHACIGLRQ